MRLATVVALLCLPPPESGRCMPRRGFGSCRPTAACWPPGSVLTSGRGDRRRRGAAPRADRAHQRPGRHAIEHPGGRCRRRAWRWRDRNRRLCSAAPLNGPAPAGNTKFSYARFQRRRLRAAGHRGPDRRRCSRQRAAPRRALAARGGPAGAKNVILLLGDGMGAAHRTAARHRLARVARWQGDRPLAMDTLEVTGQVMTPSLNSAITDSAPGMASYSTGHKSNNNQEGVYPDNTADPFDNPRVEYIGELLRRTRGRGFNVGIVTTADVTDATPAANAVHTANRSASAGHRRRVLRRARGQRRERSSWAAARGTSGPRSGRRASGRTRDLRPSSRAPATRR